MKLLIIDNYDSFTYNLVYMIRQMGIEYDVIRNDRFDLNRLGDYGGMLLSPGPGIPAEAGDLLTIMSNAIGSMPILGICLGHQALAVHFGGKLGQLKHVYHGVESTISLASVSGNMFLSLQSPITAGRYHSWIVDESCLPSNFNVTARDEAGIIMAMEDVSQKLYGLQFHPESIMSPNGKIILNNFIATCKLSMP